VDELNRLYERTWLLLKCGIENRKHPFHTPVVCTIRNSEPRSRTVILRSADELKRTLRFHTDIRSSKISDIRSLNRLSWTFYSIEDKLQVSVQSEAVLHHENEITSFIWSAMSAMSQQTYSVFDPPGTVVTNEPSLVDGYQNFCVVECEMISMEVLSLHHTGNIRAIFKVDQEGYYIAP
jgi:hypothetical protein